ncbi:hypothetical protein GCM10027343_42860 [Noviherbaspirillum agri]
MDITGLLALTALDDFVEFAAVQPYAPALGAIIDFDVLPLGHNELCFLAYGALHNAIHSRVFIE